MTINPKHTTLVLTNQELQALHTLLSICLNDPGFPLTQKELAALARASAKVMRSLPITG